MYYWRVRGIDGGANVIGLWSAADAAHTYRFRYETGATSLLTPADNATVATPVLSWAAVPNVERYQVTIKKSGGSTARTATTYATSYTPPALSASDGPFSWYVQTIDGTGNTSSIPASSDWFHFSLTDPTTDTSMSIIAPADGASSVRMPSIQWQPYAGADYYKVWYGPQGGLYNVTPLSGGTQQTFAAFTSTALPLTAGTYKYFVEAFNVLDDSIATSAERTFVIEAPATLGTLDYLTPDRCSNPATCDTVADTPTLSWQSVPGAGAYEVTIANDANFTNQVVTYKTIFTTLTPRSSFLDSQANKAFYWFVRPCVTYALTDCGPDEGTSANNNASAFRKRSAPVDLVSPADGATVEDLVTFTWTDYLATNQDLAPAVDQEAKSYKIQVSTVADFSSILDTATVDQTTYTPYSKTYPKGPCTGGSRPSTRRVTPSPSAPPVRSPSPPRRRPRPSRATVTRSAACHTSHGTRRTTRPGTRSRSIPATTGCGHRATASSTRRRSSPPGPRRRRLPAAPIRGGFAAWMPTAWLDRGRPADRSSSRPPRRRSSPRSTGPASSPRRCSSTGLR